MKRQGLVTFRDHCLHMAESPNNSEDDRALWARLAAEVDTYLSPEGSDDPHPALFGERE